MPKHDVSELVVALQQAHILVRDAETELEAEAEFAAEDDRSVGRGFQFAAMVLPEAIVWLEHLADLLADHFGVVFLHEAVDSEQGS